MIERIEAEREVFGKKGGNLLAVAPGQNNDRSAIELDITTPSTPLAVTWQGYGTALKPAWEPVIVARKPLAGTVAENCVEYGAGALWIDGARVGTEGEQPKGSGNRNGNGNAYQLKDWIAPNGGNGGNITPPAGRWPSNFIHDGSDEVVGEFPRTKSNSGNLTHSERNNPNGIYGKYGAGPTSGISDEGSAARFFYCAKASKRERDAGCEGMEEKQYSHDGRETPIENVYQRKQSLSRNHHPTVKPIALTEYLARLILPPAEYAPRRLLVPFSGSGSEMIGAHRAGWDEVTGIEMDAEYCQIAEARLKHWEQIPIQLEMTGDKNDF